MWQAMEVCQVGRLGIGRGACTEPPGPRSGPAHWRRNVVRYSEPFRIQRAAAANPERHLGYGAHLNGATRAHLNGATG